jgi:hypothetical protein
MSSIVKWTTLNNNSHSQLIIRRRSLDKLHCIIQQTPPVYLFIFLLPLIRYNKIRTNRRLYCSTVYRPPPVGATIAHGFVEQQRKLNTIRVRVLIRVLRPNSTGLERPAVHYISQQQVPVSSARDVLNTQMACHHPPA